MLDYAEPVTKLIDEFRVHPFIHRVEHSLHIRLVQLLSEWEHLRGWYPIGDSGFKTQLIHKEWPEARPRKEPDLTADRRRGSFDLVILAPSQLQRTALEQFRVGRIDAPIVIELGLRVGIAHHLGWAVAVTASAGYDVVDRRRIELIESGMPAAPVEHEVSYLDDEAAARMVAAARASALRAGLGLQTGGATLIRRPSAQAVGWSCERDGWAGQVGEQAADLVGAGGVQLPEGRQGLGPVRSRLLRAPERPQGHAQLA